MRGNYWRQIEETRLTTVLEVLYDLVPDFSISENYDDDPETSVI